MRVGCLDMVQAAAEVGRQPTLRRHTRLGPALMVERPVRRTIGLFLAHERNHLQPVVPLAELASWDHSPRRRDQTLLASKSGRWDSWNHSSVQRAGGLAGFPGCQTQVEAGRPVAVAPAGPDHTAVVHLTERRRPQLGVGHAPLPQALRTSDRSSPSLSRRQLLCRVAPGLPVLGHGYRCQWAVDRGHILAGRGCCTDPDEADHILGRPYWEEHRSQARGTRMMSAARQN